MKLRYILLLAFTFLFPRRVYAQLPIPPELACPSGFQVMPGGQTFNPSTGEYRQWLCVNNNGNVSIQVNAGSLAVKPAVTDNILYVSTTGSDINDGLSEGSAKQTLEGCYTALPNTGAGTCVVMPLFAESMASDLVMNKNSTGFFFLGQAEIAMHAHTVTVTPGTGAVFFEGMIAFGGLPGFIGVQFTYTGTGTAFTVGSSSVDTRAFKFNNIAISLSGTGASATGLDIIRVQEFEIHNSGAVASNGTYTTSIGFEFDGSGTNFVGEGVIENPYLSFLTTSLLATGSGANSMNAVTIIGGVIAPAGGPTSIGVDLEDSDSITILGTDIDLSGIGVKLGANCFNSRISIRTETNTTDIVAVSGSKDNIVTSMSQPAGTPVNYTDAGTNNKIGRNADTSMTIASGQVTMTTAIISPSNCGATVSVTASNVLTTDTLNFSLSAAPVNANGFLIVNVWPLSGSVNFNYCNPTAAAITPAASTLNWNVVR